MSYSDYLENELLDHWLGNSAYTAPATVYVGLSTADPLDDGSGLAEPVGNGYARVSVTNNLTEWPAAVGGSKNNANDVTFPLATGSWGTITHFALFDAATGGNMLGSGALTSSRTVSDGDQPRFAAGEITVTLD